MTDYYPTRGNLFSELISYVFPFLREIFTNIINEMALKKFLFRGFHFKNLQYKASSIQIISFFLHHMCLEMKNKLSFYVRNNDEKIWIVLKFGMPVLAFNGLVWTWNVPVCTCRLLFIFNDYLLCLQIWFERENVGYY